MGGFGAVLSAAPIKYQPYPALRFKMDFVGLLLFVSICCALVYAVWEPIQRARLSGRWDVFVSYRSSDRDLVTLLVCEMEFQGLTVWFDQSEIGSMESKVRFDRPIARGLQLCAVAIIFSSFEYCASRYCREEAQFLVSRFAVEGAYRLIEVKLDNYPSRDLLHLPVRSPIIFAEGYRPRDPVLIELFARKLIEAVNLARIRT